MIYNIRTNIDDYYNGWELFYLEMTEKLCSIGEAFGIEGLFFSYEEIKMGNVNHTYKVNYVIDNKSGVAVVKPYLFQQVNTYAFRKPIELMSNVGLVTDHIRMKYPNRVNLHFHHTEDRKPYLETADGFWRIMNFIPSVTYDSCKDNRIIRSAGEAFGEFQQNLDDFDASSLYYTIPDFHNTRKRYETFISDVNSDPIGRVSEVSQEIDWLISVKDKACILTDMYDRGELPLRVTHNDTKINNVLFDCETQQPLTVIDLDTVMPGLVGHDFGDAIRFAANFVKEDYEDASKAGLDLNIFWAFTEGFLSRTAKTLTDSEIQTLGISSFVLACELSTRFLDDYIMGDKYFKINNPKHNLTRTRCQISLAKDMLNKMDAMNAIVEECAYRNKNS